MNKHIKLALRNYLSDLRTWELFAAVAFVVVVLACCGCETAQKPAPRMVLVSRQFVTGTGYVNVLRDRETGREFINASGCLIEIKPREEQ